MKTTIESYQNQAKKENQRITLNNSSITNRIRRNYLLQIKKTNKQNRRLLVLRSFNILLAERKKITFDKFMENKNRLGKRILLNINTVSIKPILVTPVSQIEINTLNELIPVTPIITKNKRIKTLIKYAVCRCISKKDSYEVFNKNFYKLNLKIKANEESILKAS